MLEALERGFKKFEIDFYLIGAVARDVWMRAINDLSPRRATRDIDFAILINNNGVYEALKDYLIEQEGFRAYQNNAFVLLWPGNLQVDLMPFGSIEKEDKIKVEGTGLTTLHVPGFKEVYEAGLPEIELEDNQRFKFCTVPGIVLLKLLAWYDRPEVRSSDIQDISDMLLHYFDMFADDIYENHYDLFGEENKAADYLLHIAAQALGREIGKIARKNPPLVVQILTIFEENTRVIAKSPIADLMAGFFNNSVENNIALLLKVKRGIEEIIAP